MQTARPNKALAGIRVKARAALLDLDRHTLLAEETGEVQFTDYGLSGICIMQLSGLLAAVPRVQEDLWQAAGVLLVLLVSLGLGYLTMSLIGGVAGACCSGMEEAGEATGPVMLLTMTGYLASCVVGAVPSGPVAVFSTLCPVVSIFCAPVQFAGGNVSFWLVLASWAIQAAVIWGLLTLASRVYAGLIVHRGSRVKLRELMSMAKGGAVR